MRFTPLTPARLVGLLAEWTVNRGAERAAGPVPGRAHGTVIGFDGLSEAGATALADDVADAIRRAGRPVIRASTYRWWRPAALRLELGRQDIDMLLTGWVDADALRRELIDPVVTGGRPFIARLRDPRTDRSVRVPAQLSAPMSILLLDGPFLLTAGLPLDGVVSLGVDRAALLRALPVESSWWVDAFDRYRTEYRPADRADVLLSYDHPSTPAAFGLDGERCS